MARFDFGGTLADFVVTARRLGGFDVLGLASATLTFWDSQAGGTRYTDLQLNGSAVSSIVVGSDGQVPKFQGPDGVTEMWADGGSPRIRVVTLQGAPGPTGPQGAASTVPGPQGSTGPQGIQGLPGVNAVANDTATAGYITGPSGTKTALDAGYAALATIAPTATASATLVANKHTPVDAAAAARTMTLPTAAVGALISVEKTDASANAVNVTGTMRGVATQTIPLTTQYDARTFLSEGGGSWRPVSDHRTTASLAATVDTLVNDTTPSSTRTAITNLVATREGVLNAKPFFSAAQLAGTADAGPAINSAISAGVTAGASKVVLPALTKTVRYAIATTVNLGPDMELDCNGATLIVTNGATLTNGVLWANTRTNVTVSNVRILGPADGATGGAGIRLTTCTNTTLSNVYMSGLRGHSIQASSCTGLTIRRAQIIGGANCVNIITASDLKLIDCDFSGSFRNSNAFDANLYLESITRGIVSDVTSMGAASHGMFLVGSTDVLIQNSRFNNNGAATGFTGNGWFRGVSIGSTAICDRIQFVNCQFNANREDGILVPGVSPGTTDHGFFSLIGCTAIGNNLIGSVGGHGFEINSRWAVIKGCTATGNNSGIWLQNSVEAVVEGNLARGNAGSEGDGISVFSPNGGVKVVNNICKSNGRDGVYLNGQAGDSCAYLSAIGNEVASNGRYGISTTNLIAAPAIALNMSHDNTTAQASLAHTGTGIVANNQGF